VNINLPYKFNPRSYQIPMLKALDKGMKKHVWCLHRGCGKDLLALNYLIREAATKRGVYLHCFPNYSQAKRAIWKSNHGTDDGNVVGYLEHFPEELIKYKNASEMTIELINGSIYCLMGVDGKNANRARGMNPNFVILSEYAFMDPESWYTIEPRLTQNNGTVIFASTPNGQNHFYHLYNHAKLHPETYFSKLLTIEDTSVFEKSFIDQKRSEGIPEDFIQQEYFCSFERGAEGSYYGKYIQAARNEDRITNINHNIDLPVHTAWDIGVGDSTSIWLFQLPKNGNIHLLHYYENSGTGAEHYFSYLDDWKTKHKAIWGMHYFPHDMKNREWGNNADERTQVADRFGYNVTVLKAETVESGIQLVRNILPHCIFDQRNCKAGLDCLDFYRKKWNDALKVYYDQPLHDRYSNGADAFRYLAMGIKRVGEAGKLNGDKIKEMRVKHYGY